jgi:hypothetical protein
MGKDEALNKPLAITIKSVATLHRIQIVEQAEVIQEPEDREATIAFGMEGAGKSAFGRSRYLDKDCFWRCKESTKRTDVGRKGIKRKLKIMDSE